jgi:hypothetical protein
MKSCLLCFLLVWSLAATAQGRDAYANSNGVRSRYDECQRKLDEINGKVAKRNGEYEQEKKEFLAGLFCSDCNRAKSQIEKETGKSFEAHIQEGAKNGRHVKSVTQKQLDDLHQRYMREYNNLKQQYESTKQNCNNLANQFNEARNQDQQNQIKSQQDAQRQAQEKAQAEQQAKVRELQEQQRLREELERQRQIREQMARDEMLSKMQANNDEAEAKKEAYGQESQLSRQYRDRSSDAQSLLQRSGSVDDSEVFGTYGGGNDGSDVSKKSGLLGSIMDNFNEFRQSARDKVSSLFGRRASESDNVWGGVEEEQPSSGWSFERTRLNRRVIQPLKELYEKTNTFFQNGENYEDKWTRRHDLWENARPRSNEQTREDIEDRADEGIDLVMRSLDRFKSDDLSEGSADLDQDLEHIVDKIVANATGNILGKSKFLNRLNEKYEDKIADKVDTMMFWYKNYRGNQ